MKNAELTFKKQYPEAWGILSKADLTVIRHDRCYWLKGCGEIRQLDGYATDENGDPIKPEDVSNLVTKKIKSIIDARTKLLCTSLNDRFENLVAHARKTPIRHKYFTTVQEPGGDRVVLSEFVKCYVDFRLEGCGEIRGEGKTKDEAITHAIKLWNEGQIEKQEPVAL